MAVHDDKGLYEAIRKYVLDRLQMEMSPEELTALTGLIKVMCECD